MRLFQAVWHESPVSVTKSRFLLRQNRATVLSLNQLYFSGGKSWLKKPTRSSLLPEEVPASDGLQKLFQTLCRQVLCLHRNQGVCRRQCVNRQHPRRSATSSGLSPSIYHAFSPCGKDTAHKGLEPSAACRPCKGQQDKHPLLGEWTKDHQSEVLLPSGGKPWFRFSIYASHVRYGNFSPAKRKSSSASHDMWQRRRAFVMESFCFNYSDIRSDLHGVP